MVSEHISPYRQRIMAPAFKDFGKKALHRYGSLTFFLERRGRAHLGDGRLFLQIFFQYAMLPNLTLVRYNIPMQNHR